MSSQNLKKSSKDNDNGIDKEYLDELYNKGVDFYEEEEYQKALALFQKLVSVSPNDSDAWCFIGDILGILGKLKESLDSLNKSLKIKPNDTIALTNKGVTLSELG